MGEKRLRKIPAWENRRKGRPVYLRERRSPSLPKRAVLSQGGTLCRYEPILTPARQELSQAGTMRREYRTTSLLGRTSPARADPPLPSRDDAQPRHAALPLFAQPAFSRAGQCAAARAAFLLRLNHLSQAKTLRADPPTPGLCLFKTRQCREEPRARHCSSCVRQRHDRHRRSAAHTPLAMRAGSPSC